MIFGYTLSHKVDDSHLLFSVNPKKIPADSTQSQLLVVDAVT